MRNPRRGFRVCVLFVLIPSLCWVESVNGIGANWGTQSSHPLPPETVVRMLVDNGIQKVKLFDADYGALRALSKSGIEVMVGIPNDMLSTMASSMKAAEKWVSKNVSAHLTNSVNIRSPLHYFSIFCNFYLFLIVYPFCISDCCGVYIHLMYTSCVCWPLKWKKLETLSYG